MQFLATKSPYLRNGAKWDHGYNDGQWYQNHRPSMTLNGRYPLYCKKHSSFGPNQSPQNIEWR